MLRRALTFILDRLTKDFHRLHFVGHVGYFLAVFTEGHGLYAGAAGLMCLLTILGYFFNQE